MARPRLEVGKPAKVIKQQRRQTKFAALADKKTKGKLTLEDLDEKLNIVIEMLEDLLAR